MSKRSAGVPDRTRRARLCVIAMSAGVLTLAACGDGATEPDAAPSTTRPVSSGPSPTAPELAGDVIVFEAASLTEAFDEIATAFMAANPGVTVTLNPAASSALAQQIVGGAPADVFASASTTTMAVVTDAGLAAGEPTIFVRNRLQIAVPAGNPGDVTSLADLADEALTIALCAEEVPCGAAAIKAFAAAGITPAPDTLEQDVKAALTKVELGEVDAALVYRTDVIAAGDTVEGIDFLESADAINDYPIVALADAPNRAAAEAFVAYVLSEPSLDVLADAGFDVE